MRADAERNRQRILEAASRLFAEVHDPDRVSMDAIALEAGVGKGTLFRRFGSRDALIAALFEERARELVTRVRATGPEVSPPRRILAMLDHLAEAKSQNPALAVAIDGGTQGPYGTEIYAVMHALLSEAICEARGECDADFFAHAALALVRNDMLEHLGGWENARFRDGLTALVGLMTSGGD